MISFVQFALSVLWRPGRRHGQRYRSSPSEYGTYHDTSRSGSFSFVLLSVDSGRAQQNIFVIWLDLLWWFSLFYILWWKVSWIVWRNFEDRKWNQIEFSVMLLSLRILSSRNLLYRSHSLISFNLHMLCAWILYRIIWLLLLRPVSLLFRVSTGILYLMTIWPLWTILIVLRSTKLSSFQFFTFSAPIFSLDGVFGHDFWGRDLKAINSHKSYRPLTVADAYLPHFLC